jgi:hypothetical protein
MKAWRLKSAVVALLLTLVVGSVYAFHNFPKDSFDKFQSETSIMRAVTKTTVSESLPIMEKIVMVWVQDDEAALTKVVMGGLASGQLVGLQEGTKVFWVKGVNEAIMAIRPEGSDRIYYAVRVFFEMVSSKEGNK